METLKTSSLNGDEDDVGPDDEKPKDFPVLAQLITEGTAQNLKAFTNDTTTTTKTLSMDEQLNNRSTSLKTVSKGNDNDANNVNGCVNECNVDANVNNYNHHSEITTATTNHHSPSQNGNSGSELPSNHLVEVENSNRSTQVGSSSVNSVHDGLTNISLRENGESSLVGPSVGTNKLRPSPNKDPNRIAVVNLSQNGDAEAHVEGSASAADALPNGAVDAAAAELRNGVVDHTPHLNASSSFFTADTDQSPQQHQHMQEQSEQKQRQQRQQQPWCLAAAPSLSTTLVSDGISYVRYESESQMPDIMRLITKDLSEPYSIYTYRYFIHNWPKLCFLAMDDDKCVGAIVCKLDVHKKMANRGYIAMLAVDTNYRRRNIGSTLVRKAIRAMILDEASACDEVVLETEITNTSALRLYENLGFVRDKRLFRYYLNGVDALRLKLWLR